MRLSDLPSNSNALAISGAAALAGAALLFLRQRRISARFERLGGAALETLLDAIDANDPLTGAHVRRVARYALVLADVMGVDDHMCHSIERVALFHDIGKIHQALFDVIHDDRKLTPDERRSIRTHPERGARVLEPLASFYPDLPAGVLAHHERWDGTGYPRGLRGGRIPLSARVVAIADTFDAITHSRRYSAARTLAAGWKAIGEGRGTQFDPTLVDLFLSPPVQQRVRDEQHAAGRLEQSSRRRAEHGATMQAPDVSFRWRATPPAEPRLRKRAKNAGPR